LNLINGSLPDRLAAEYVLGTLTGGARRRFEKLVQAHPRLHQAVVDWEVRTLPLALGAPPIQPGEAVWRRLHAQLIGPVAGSPAQGVRSLRSASVLTTDLRHLRLWKAYGALATAIALSLALMVRHTPADPPLIVVLHATKGSEVLIAGLSADRARLSIRPLERVNLSRTQSLELWALPRTGAPSSLGVISADGMTALHRKAIPADTTGLAVTLEPLGGAPHGVATGPLLFKGDLTL